MELYDSWPKRLNITNIFIHPKVLYTFKKPYQNSKNSFFETGQVCFAIHVKMERAGGALALLIIMSYYKVTVIKKN